MGEMAEMDVQAWERGYPPNRSFVGDGCPERRDQETRKGYIPFRTLRRLAEEVVLADELTQGKAIEKLNAELKKAGFRHRKDRR